MPDSPLPSRHATIAFMASLRSPTLACVGAVLCASLLADVGCGAPEPQGELPPVEDLANVQQASIDCTQWTDTGYVDGVPFQITLVTADGKPVEVSTANAYVVMQQAAAADGVSIKIVSGFRTYAEQQYFYNCYINCNCNNCNLAAKPGYSNHQSGHALDLNTSTSSVLNWLNSHGGAYGFKRTVPSEDWHWEFWGGGPGGGPCDDNTPPTPCTVTATGKTGECMDTTVCADIGGYESTPGYCPGPSNIQCCTAGGSPAACTVTATGKSGVCLYTTECDALGGHESTPGYCQGPKSVQCCTEKAPPPPADAGVEEDAAVEEDAEAPNDAAIEPDAAVTPDAAIEPDAAPTQDATVSQDAASGQDGGVNPAEVWATTDSGSCSVASGARRNAPRGEMLGAMVAAILLAVSRRRRG